MTDNVDDGLRELSAKRFNRAAQFAQYALAEDPDDVRALGLLSIASLQSGNLEVGIDSLEQLALIRPLDNQSQVELAIAYGAVGRRKLSYDLLMTIAVSGKLTAEQLLRVAVGLEAIDEPHLAMEACRQAGKLSPDLAEVHYQMGFYAQRCGRPVNVSEALIRYAINLDPRNLHYRIGLASLLIRIRRSSEAIAVISSMIPQRLQEVTCRCCLKRIANLLFDCDKIDEARLCAQRLAELDREGLLANDASESVATRKVNRAESLQITADIR